MKTKDPLSYKVIGCAMEVYNTLGPGLLESAYEKALIHELRLNGLSVVSQVPIEMSYKGVNLGEGLRIEDSLIVELRICLNFSVNRFYVILFSLFEALFDIFTLFVLANRPLFAATKQCKSAQKHLSTKLEIKSKQILKSVEELKPIHYKQLLTYLKLTKQHIGLLINFNVNDFRDGIRRVVNGYQES